MMGAMGASQSSIMLRWPLRHVAVLSSSKMCKSADTFMYLHAPCRSPSNLGLTNNLPCNRDGEFAAPYLLGESNTHLFGAKRGTHH